jgi:hypothetical protein
MQMHDLKQKDLLNFINTNRHCLFYFQIQIWDCAKDIQHGDLKIDRKLQIFNVCEVV